MPEPLDREAFLAGVSSRLDLPEAIARDVLEELTGHLDEAAADLRAGGYAADDADRRAVRDLGDPGLLARDLARARHDRRRLLAAVGGGVRAVLVEGTRTYLFFAIFGAVTAALAMPIASAILHLFGRSTSSYFGGPLGSGVTVVMVGAAFACLGWILPARIAGPAQRSVHGVRRAIAALGFMGASAVIWLLLRLALDPVLAVGLPLAPLAFAAAAMHAPRRPTLRLGVVPGLVMTVALIVPMTLVALATTTLSTHGWTADTSSIGEAPAPGDVENTSVAASFQYGDWGDMRVVVDLGDAAPILVTRYRTLRVEVWPAADRDGWIAFGDAPIVAGSLPTERLAAFDLSVPRLRDRVTIATFLVAVAPDGRRVVIAQDLSLPATPPWTGTVADWWLGR